MSPTAPASWPRSPRCSATTTSRSARWNRTVRAARPACCSSPTRRGRGTCGPPSTGWPGSSRWNGSEASCGSSGTRHEVGTPPDRGHGHEVGRASMKPVDRSGPWRGVIEEYRAFLPVSSSTPVVTLLEGCTPLLPAPRLSSRVGARVLLKVEGANPTGSFKDRGMTVAISKAAEEGAKAVGCASTGNTSASSAAFAARAGLTCAVLIPEGHIALGKLAQALIHGARVLQVRGNFDEALDIVRRLGDEAPVTVVNSVNPFRIEGQKSGAFEIVDELGDAPDVHCIPVGNAGNITAYWKGYLEFKEAGRSTKLPRMLGFQAAGAAPIVEGHPVEFPETIATAIRIGNPASWYGATSAASESGGGGAPGADENNLEAYRFLAAEESVFCEPASAASVAGLLKTGLPEGLGAGSTVVCVLTGHGLKDPDIAISQISVPTVVDAALGAVLAELSL